MEFQVLMDFNRDGNFDHTLSDVSNRVRDVMFWSSGFTYPDQVESNPVAHVAPVNTLSLTLDNSDGQLAFEASGALFYNLIASGIMVKVVATVQGNSHSFTYFAQRVHEAPGQFALQTVTLECVCAMPRIQRANYDPLVEQNVSTSAALTTMLGTGVVTLPYTSSYFFIDHSSLDSGDLIFDASTDVPLIADIESGYTEMEYVGDIIRHDNKGLIKQSAQMFLSDLCISEAFGRFYYQPRDAKFHFHNRYHDRLQTSQRTFVSDEYIYASAISTAVYNEVRLNYTPRNLGTAGGVIFASDGVPFPLKAGIKRTIRVRYHDPDNENADVAAIDIIPIVQGTDVIGLDEDNNDITPEVFRSAELNGTGGTIYLDNNTEDDINITKIQVRGTPVTTYQEQIAEARNGDSMALYNWQALPAIHGAYITDASLAQGVCDFLIRRHKTPRRVFESVQFRLDDSNFNDVLAITIGDVVTIEESWSGHQTEYVVLGEYHQLDIAYSNYDVTWYLRSNDITPYFIVDISYIDSDDLIGY